MNDRFKFRIFIKNFQGENNSLMCDVHSLHIGTKKAIVSSLYGNCSVKINENNIVMQSTGLKDKNGKLIYEGDIVKCYFTNADTEQLDYDLMKVIWDDNASAFGLEGLRTSSLEYFSYFEFNSEEYEVIGNIYENKELLEG